MEGISNKLGVAALCSTRTMPGSKWKRLHAQIGTLQKLAENIAAGSACPQDGQGPGWGRWEQRGTPPMALHSKAQEGACADPQREAAGQSMLASEIG